MLFIKFFKIVLFISFFFVLVYTGTNPSLISLAPSSLSVTHTPGVFSLDTVVNLSDTVDQVSVSAGDYVEFVVRSLNSATIDFTGYIAGSVEFV